MYTNHTGPKSQQVPVVDIPSVGRKLPQRAATQMKTVYAQAQAVSCACKGTHIY